MKKIISAIVASSLLICSCSKKEGGVQAHPPQSYIWHPNSGPAKKDETRPIVIIKPVRPNGIAIQSLIGIFNNSDTLTGNTINDSECQFNLPVAGMWSLQIVSQGYISLQKQVNYVDSFIYEVDTLQPAD